MPKSQAMEDMDVLPESKFALPLEIRHRNEKQEKAR
jgi:hypothetical protein